MNGSDRELCPLLEIESLVSAIQEDQDLGMDMLQTLLGMYRDDARLHFMHGSLCAGQGRFFEGKQSMERAITLSPDYHIARFQLGFLEFTSGDAARAQQIWAPLAQSSVEPSLRFFSEGLVHLAADDFDAALLCLRAGIIEPDTLPEMAADMQKIVDAISEMRDVDSIGNNTSAAHLLLQRYTDDQTRH